MTISGQTLIDRVRIELSDVDSTQYKWSNRELIIYANDAIRDYSKHFRVAHTTTFLDTGAVDDGMGMRALTMPVECQAVQQLVYHFKGVAYFIREKPYKGGEVDLEAGIALYPKILRPVLIRNVWRWTLSTDANDLDAPVVIKINFVPAQGSTIVVNYLTGHSLLSDTNLSLATTIPDDDEELLSLYTQAKAFARIGGQTADLDRWREEGRRNDSPVIPWDSRLFAAYKAKLTQKQARPRPMRLRRV